MHKRFVRPRLTALATVVVLTAALLMPVASAQSQLNVRSVGEIFVDAAGKASGQNVATSIVEASGQLEAFTSLALGAELFSSVSIDGFAQAQKIQGVGSSNIILRGSNAVVTVYDNINSAFRVQATQDTSVNYKLSSEVKAKLDAETRHSAHLYSGSGAYLGSLVLLGAEGEASGSSWFAADASGNLKAKLESSDQVVFRARPVYVDAQAYNEAVVEAMAEGELTAQVVTEFDAKGESQSKIDYFSTVSTETSASAQGSMETTVKSRAEASAIVAYDLAYESLQAKSDTDIAVYADGELAARAQSAAEVQAYAKQGVASYYAFTANGRTQVLASTPDFKAEAQHRLTLVANAAAQSSAQAQAEARAEADARVSGHWDLHANGKLTGEFATGVVAEAKSEIHAYTDLKSKTEIFSTLRIEGQAESQVEHRTESELTLSGPNADVTLHDDFYATLLVEAKARTEASFDLAANVKARAESSSVLHLTSESGAHVGTMVIAKADGSAAASSHFATSAEGNVKAQLEQGARVIFRAHADAKAQASAQAQASARAAASMEARAIAEGKLGASFLAGFKGDAVATTRTEFYSNVQAEVTAAAQGHFELEYQAHAETATSFVFESRGTALSAKAASDIEVLVDGQAAVATTSAEAALAASAQAKYYVDTSLESSTRVLVNVGASAKANAHVTIQSKLDAAAKASANADAFGTFKLFYDGTAVGSFVSLKTDAQAGVVSDYSMTSTGAKIFTSVKAGASSFVSAGQDGASTLILENSETKMEISDTTSAYMKIVAKAETDAQFRLASSMQATAKASNVVELTSESGAHVGSMIITNVEGRASAESRFEMTAQNQIRAHLEQGAQIVFKTHVGIETELSAAQRTMINHAIASGQVAGQVLVQTQASLAAQAYAAAQAKAKLEATAHAQANADVKAKSHLEATASASGSVTQSITASYYNDVQMVTAATKNRVDVTISSAVSAGKTVIISLDQTTLAGMQTGDAEILIDGQAAVQASSYADILNAGDDSGVSEYFVLAGEAGTQVLVSIPHFSTRTVTLKAHEPSAPPVFMYATIFLGVLVVAETVVLVRQRRAL